MQLTLRVLRCKELGTSKRFYALLGFRFVEERHGGGTISSKISMAGKLS